MAGASRIPGVAVVTGAGSGIGRACALALAGEGWRVVLAGRRREALEETAALAAGAEMLVVPTDVTVEADVAALFDAAVARFGRVDFVFNNAGTNTAATPIDELPVGEWTRVVSANLTGVFLCMREAFRVMKRQQPQGGRIVNNGSISAHVPRPHSAPYTAAKHGVTGLTKSGSLDGRAFGIAVGQIDIGNVASDMTSRMSGGVLQAHGAIAPEPVMAIENVARTLTHMAALPLDANIFQVTVMATDMPFVGRG
ncbi:SDR family oxidoreductase [Aureimonas flava]|uniref:SDR family oxidoreductase n=1 Tax=Aureimonas flava TaxID=2320271 RepID=A0A3A1WH90_9HYPH|nr:SDR family oxidoreductase [Aureimonas flava]RIX99756.1 SDR family oxidoreductase [Aureimonas flava]